MINFHSLFQLKFLTDVTQGSFASNSNFNQKDSTTLLYTFYVCILANYVYFFLQVYWTEWLKTGIQHRIRMVWFYNSDTFSFIHMYTFYVCILANYGYFFFFAGLLDGMAQNGNTPPNPNGMVLQL